MAGYRESQKRTVPRRWTQTGFWPFQLEVLTPVFIGSGEDLSPFEYVLRSEEQSFGLYLVDTEAWFVAMADKSDIRDALNKGDLLRLRRLMHEQLDVRLYAQARIHVAKALGDNLKEKIFNNDSRSNVEVQPFIRNVYTKTAYVPGSSLKGALSTPLIDYLDQGTLKSTANDFNLYYLALKKIFGDINEHAMQAIKVSDINLPHGDTEIVSANEIKKQINGKTRMPTRCEVLRPSAEQKFAFYGRLLLDTHNHDQPCITLP
ncbi:MAG: hypothetical protein IJS50_01475, partial [Desulfovibrio sp.]|nr:hypothetical protein [Desulfovibrio sp.]